jgi:hypothetical protein
MRYFCQVNPLAHVFGMKRVEHYRRYLGSVLLLFLLVLSSRAAAKSGDIIMGKAEQTFPVLQTKTGAYTNVTVTKKTKDWIFIIHSAGVCNLKASDLPTDARIALGYEAPPKTPGADGVTTAETSGAESATTSKLPHINLAEVKQFAADWRLNRKEKESEIRSFITAHATIVCIFLGALLALHVIVSAIFWMICRKTHNSPGPLVWVPFLQLIPLLRAANMPRAWFFAFFVPVVNIVAVVIFCIKIVKSRGKGVWVSILLMLPPLSGLAMLYLAFSSSAPVEMAHNEVLSLETA